MRERIKSARLTRAMTRSPVTSDPGPSVNTKWTPAEIAEVFLGAGGLAVALASLAILFNQNALIEQQNSIAAKQIQLSEQQTSLMNDQNKISSEQASIASKQTSLMRQQTALMDSQTSLMAAQTEAAEAQAVPAYEPRLKEVRDLAEAIRTAGASMTQATYPRPYECGKICGQQRAGDLSKSIMIKLSQSSASADRRTSPRDEAHELTRYESYFFDKMMRLSKYEFSPDGSEKILKRIGQACFATRTEIHDVRTSDQALRQFKAPPEGLSSLTFIWPFFFGTHEIAFDRSAGEEDTNPSLAKIDEGVEELRKRFNKGLVVLLQRCNAQVRVYEEKIAKLDRRVPEPASGSAKPSGR